MDPDLVLLQDKSSLEWPIKHDEFKIISDERLGVDQATVRLLASTLGLLQREPITYSGYGNTLHDLRLDEPILASDPEVDVIQLRERNSLSRSKAVSILQLKLDSTLDCEWLSDQREPLIKFDKNLLNEKLDIDTQAVRCLRNIHVYTQAETLHLQDGSQHAEVERPNIMSSPLLPASYCSSPDSISTILNLVSTAPMIDNPFTEAKDRTLVNVENELSEHLESPFDISREWQEDVFMSLTHADITLQDSAQPLILKMDLTSLPLNPALTHVVNPNTVHDHRDISAIEQHLRTGGDQSDTQVQRLEHHPEQQLEKSEISSLNRLCSDRTVQHDPFMLVSTKKITVPTIDEPQLTTPWLTDGEHDTHSHNNGIASMTISDAQELLLIPAHSRWSGITALERKLPWSPFPKRLATVPADFVLEDDRTEEILVELQLHRDPEVEDFTAKFCTTLLLESADNTFDLLEPSSPATVNPFESTANHDKIPVFERLPPNPQSNLTLSPTSCGSISMNALLKKRKLELGAQDTSASKDDKADGPRLKMQAHGLLAFMRLQGKSVHEDATEPKPTHSNLPNDNAAIAATLMQTQEPDELSLATGPLLSLPAPTIHNPNDNFTSVVSSTMLSNHRFIRALQSHLPALDLIPREPLHSSFSDEADLTPSSTAGILLTTPQELKQKPLPGRSSSQSTPTLLSRIQVIAKKYEALHILVRSNSSSISAPGAQRHYWHELSGSDAEALTSLASAGSALAERTSVHVHYVGGGDEAAASWAAALVSRLAAVVSAGSREAEWAAAAAEETRQERMLRHAGMNAFAARAVVMENEGGVAEFVAMGPRERRRKYAARLGEQILDRLSEMVHGRFSGNVCS